MSRADRFRDLDPMDREDLEAARAPDPDDEYGVPPLPPLPE